MTSATPAQATGPGLPARIPFLMLAFFDPFVIEATLESLLPCRDKIDVIVVENPSPYSGLVGRIVQKFVNRGLVSRHFRFEENITGNAMLTILRNEIDLEPLPYIFVSDGDIIAYDADWLDEIVTVLGRHPELFALGASLDRSNLPLAVFPEAKGWDTARRIDQGDYIEGMMGFQAVCMRGKELKVTIEHLDVENLEFRDSLLVDYCYRIRGQKWGITKQARFRHLTWDIYADRGHPYTQFKLSKTHEEHWYHRRSSPYADVTASPDTSSCAPWPAISLMGRIHILQWAVITRLVQRRWTSLLKAFPFLLR